MSQSSIDRTREIRLGDRTTLGKVIDWWVFFVASGRGDHNQAPRGQQRQGQSSGVTASPVAFDKVTGPLFQFLIRVPPKDDLISAAKVPDPLGD